MLYVFVINGKEIIEDVPYSKKDEYNKLADKTYSLVKNLTPAKYGEAKDIGVNVYEAGLSNGHIVRGQYIGSYSHREPELEMSPEEYTEKVDELLRDLPESFREFVEWYAYDRGHSDGYSSILSYMEELAEGIEVALAKMK